jgi:hypothetical protein
LSAAEPNQNNAYARPLRFHTNPKWLLSSKYDFTNRLELQCLALPARGRKHNEQYSLSRVSDWPLAHVETRYLSRYLYCFCLRCLGSRLGFVASLGYQRADSHLTWPQVSPFRLFRLPHSGEPLSRSLFSPDGTTVSIPLLRCASVDLQHPLDRPRSSFR